MLSNFHKTNLWNKVNMFKYSCVVIFAVLYSKVNGQITGDCSQKFYMPCTWIRFDGDDCSQMMLREKLSFYETNTTDVPREPHSFEANGSYKSYRGIGKLYPEVNLTFTMSQNAGKNNMMGFEVVRYDVFNNVNCYILDLSNTNWDEISSPTMDAMFWLNLYPLNPNPKPLYRFELYSLPKPANKENVYIPPLNLNLEFQGYEYMNSNAETATNWRASTSLSRNYEARTINVTIITSPDKYGFTQFSYTLVDNTSYQIIHDEISSQLWFEFTNVPSGEYRIWITPLNEGSSHVTCPCNVDLVCRHCSTTETRGFTFYYNKGEAFEKDITTMSTAIEPTAGSISPEGGKFTGSDVFETTAESWSLNSDTFTESDVLETTTGSISPEGGKFTRSDVFGTMTESESLNSDIFTESGVLETTTESESLSSDIFTESGVLETTTAKSVGAKISCLGEDSFKEDGILVEGQGNDVRLESGDARTEDLYQQTKQVLKLKSKLLKQRLQQEKELFLMQSEMLKHTRSHDLKLFRLKKKLLSRNIETALDQI